MSPMASPGTLILFGYGSRVSAGISSRFLAEGFNVVVVSRRAHPELAGVERLTHGIANLEDPSNVDKAFHEASAEYGPVSTVIYNAYPVVNFPVPNSPFSVPIDQLTVAQNTGLLSAYRAAQLLLDSKFDGSKHFLYIGNILHLHGHAWPNGFGLGLGKASAAHFVEVGAKSYGKEGKAFFYNVWEPNSDGSVTGNKVDPQGHAEIAFQLAQTKTQDAWDVPFVVKDGKAKRTGEDVGFKSNW